MHSKTMRTLRHEHRPLHATEAIRTSRGQHHRCTMSGANLEPAGYAELLDRLKVQVRIAQAQDKRAANAGCLRPRRRPPAHHGGPAWLGLIEVTRT